MTLNEKTASAAGIYSFAEVVDEACGKLKDRQIKYSIQRIQAMEDRLSVLENELDEFLNGNKNEN